MITFEDRLSVDLKGKATGVASVVGLGLRARERATKDIDFVADPRAWKRAIKARKR